MNREAWEATVHGVAKSQSRLSDFTFSSTMESPQRQEFCLFTVSPSLVAQTVKRLPTMRETQFQSLGQEDLLEKEMATHSSILAWEIPWTEEPGGLQSLGSQKSRTQLND